MVRLISCSVHCLSLLEAGGRPLCGVTQGSHTGGTESRRRRFAASAPFTQTGTGLPDVLRDLHN